MKKGHCHSSITTIIVPSFNINLFFHVNKIVPSFQMNFKQYTRNVAQ